MPSELQRQDCCFLAGYLQSDCNSPPASQLNSAVVGNMYVHEQYKKTYTLAFCVAFCCWSSDTCSSNLSSLLCRSLLRDLTTNFVWIICVWGNQICTACIRTFIYTRAWHFQIKEWQNSSFTWYLQLVPLWLCFFVVAFNDICFCNFPCFIPALFCAQIGLCSITKQQLWYLVSSLLLSVWPLALFTAQYSSPALMIK